MGSSPPHIPADLRKTIQTIKEIIAGTHSDEEIHATLKESNMDPNETAQKLLTQDPFHEVKRKWEKKKENASNRDYGDTQLKASSQGQGGKAGVLLERAAGRGSYLQHHNSYDVGAGRGSIITRDNKVHQNTNICSNSALPPSMTLQNEKSVAFASEGSSLPASANINRIVPNGSVAYVHPSQLSRGSWSYIIQHNRSADVKPTSASLIPTEITHSTLTSKSLQEQAVHIVEQHSTSSNWANSVSRVSSCTTDPVFVPSHDHCTPGLQRMIKNDVGTIGVWQSSSKLSTVAVSAESSSFSSNLMQLSQLTNCISHESAESMVKTSVSDKPAAVTHSILHDFDVNHPIELDGDHLSETQAFPSSFDMLGASPTRCSFLGGHFNSRSQQQSVGHQKAVGSNKDWKLKSIDRNSPPVSGVIGTSTNNIKSSEASISSVQSPSSAKLEDQAAKLQEKLEELNVRDDLHVIIPNHLQVPEADRTGISFGSFVAGFATNVSSSFANDECDKNYTDLPEASQEGEEPKEEHPSRQSKAASFVPSEGYSHHPKEYYSHCSEVYSHHLQTSTSTIENISSSTDDGQMTLSPTTGSLPKPFKQEPVAASGSQFSLLQNAMNYTNMESMTQFMQNNPYEPAESHQQDVSHLPNFPQAHDPSSSFYTRFLIPGLEGDTRFSPLVSSTSGSNYNGNHPLLWGQSGVSSQEAGNSVVPSTTDPAHVMQKSGTIQARIPPQQQPMAVFPQSVGVNTCQFPSNYLPYHQYLSALYAPGTVHGFTDNPGYSPRQSGSNYNLAAGSSYPLSAAAVKYSLSQHKPDTVSGNTLHGAFPMGYSSYSTPAGYAASPAATGGSGSSFDDIAGPQFKETNLYLPSQQAEGSRLWIQSPARDLSGMQTSSCYMSAQAQHSAYAATQSTHAAFAPRQSGHAVYTPTQSGHAVYAPTQSGHSTYARYHSMQPELAPNLDNLLHLSQGLGGASGQIGAYKEVNHGQLNWTNNF